tara:strand:+ start:2655 stop:3131 length:477 start_codon:yes stop_codon:yes gene_type:complete
MDIKMINISEIKPYINNPRKKVNIDDVAKSIQEFGFQQPIVVDKNKVIIVGHTRYLASKKLNLTKVPITVANLSAEQAKAYRIADNKLNESSTWDNSLLNKEITELLDANYELLNLGFSQEELENFIGFDTSNMEEFDEIEEDLPTKNTCPKCGYEYD